ncbi:MAG: hypothetical protein JO112_20765 [Planctomycetes bacterium]|nr:hypothetical protein [Planctomycetota bacterium]
MPSLADLLGQYLQRQAAAQAAGLSPEAGGEVVPFEAAPVQPVDARLAWEEALLAGLLFHPGLDVRSWKAPPEWSSVVASHEPILALPFCLGNFPQLVRNFQSLLHHTNLADLRPREGRPALAPALLDWAQQTARKKLFPQTLLALGCLRLAKQWDPAVQLLENHQTDVPAEWRAAWDNERAALAWHRGQAQEAADLWQAQPVSVPTLFNRGLAALFLDQPAAARPWLQQAVAQLPEDGAWHHLGRLYLALAEMRG